MHSLLQHFIHVARGRSDFVCCCVVLFVLLFSCVTSLPVCGYASEYYHLYYLSSCLDSLCATHIYAVIPLDTRLCLSQMVTVVVPCPVVTCIVGILWCPHYDVSSLVHTLSLSLVLFIWCNSLPASAVILSSFHYCLFVLHVFLHLSKDTISCLVYSTYRTRIYVFVWVIFGSTLVKCTVHVSNSLIKTFWLVFLSLCGSWHLGSLFGSQVSGKMVQVQYIS